MDTSEPLISIIIPTFNRDRLLHYGLRSINSLNIPWSYEILVIDEFIGDTAKKICNQYNKVRYFQTRPNNTLESISWRVPGLAINYGVKQSKGKIIILACPEIFHCDKKNVINMVTPLLKQTKLVTFTAGIDDNGDLLNKLMNCNVPEYYKPSHANALNTRFAFFLAMNKVDFVAIGGYDEDFQAGYCFDDTNFSRRLENYGCEFRQVDGLICHIFHKRLRYGLDEVKTLWSKNEALYRQRYQDVVANAGREWGVL